MKSYIYCWKKFASIKGRASRKEYWSFVLVYGIVALILVSVVYWTMYRALLERHMQFQDVMSMNQVKAMMPYHLYTWLYIGGAYLVAALIPSTTVLIRRLHDVGKNFMSVVIWCIFPLALSIIVKPLSLVFGIWAGIGWVILLILTLKDSVPGKNIYGDNPKGIESDDREEKISAKGKVDVHFIDDNDTGSFRQYEAEQGIQEENKMMIHIDSSEDSKESRSGSVGSLGSSIRREPYMETEEDWQEEVEQETETFGQEENHIDLMSNAGMNGIPNGMPNGGMDPMHSGGPIPGGMPNGMPGGTMNGMLSGGMPLGMAPMHSGGPMPGGMPNGMLNGGMNGMPNGGMNGMPNGGMNGMPNGGMNGIPNGGMNGMPNGGMSGMPNGGMNGMPNVGPNGMPNAGMPRGMGIDSMYPGDPMLGGMPNGTGQGIPEFSQFQSRVPDESKY